MKFMAPTTTYPKELRERAIRLVLETSKEYPTEYEAIRSIAAKLGIGSAETLRKWVRQAQVDSGQRPGVTTAESEQIKALKRENAELRRANEILKSASAFFAAELCATRRHGDRGVVGDRPHRAVAAAR
jgi:transposase